MIMQNNDGGRFDRSRPQASPQPETSTQQDIAAGQMYGFVPLDPNATVYRLDAAHRTILNHHLNRQAQADVSGQYEPFGQSLYFG